MLGGVEGSTLGPDVCMLCCGAYFGSVFEQHGCHCWEDWGAMQMCGGERAMQMFSLWMVKALGLADCRLTVNGVRPHSCTRTSKLSLGLTGETRVVTLILYVQVVSLCDVYVLIQCSAWKGSEVAAVKTQGCMYRPTAGAPCGLGFLHPVS